MTSDDQQRPPGRAFLRGLVLAHVVAVPLSIAVAQPLSYLALACWVVMVVRERSFASVLRSPYFWPVLCFGLVATASVAWSVRPAVSADKLHRLLLIPMLFVLPYAFSGEEKGGWRIAAYYIAGTTLLALFDVARVPIQVLQGMPLFHTGNMRDPQMYLAALCLLAAALAWFRLPRQRRWVIALLVINALGMVLHFKRGAWFACILAVTLMALLAGRKRWLLVVAAVMISLFAVPQVRERLALLKDASAPEMGGRYILWTHVAPQLLRQYPHGMGWASVRHEDLSQFGRYVQPKLSHLHNNVIHIAVELGWLGLAAWLGWMAKTATLLYGQYASRRKREPGLAWLALGALGAFAGLMINGMVEYNAGDTEVLMLLCLFMGVGALLAAQTERAGEPTPVPSAPAGPLEANP